MTWGIEFLEAELDKLPQSVLDEEDCGPPSTQAQRDAALRASLVENEARWKRQQEAERVAEQAAERARIERAEVSRQAARARRANAPSELYTRQEVFDRDHGRCYMCDVRLKPWDWHVEHVVPLARGGTDTLDNVRASCPSCNFRKGTQAPCYRKTF